MTENFVKVGRLPGKIKEVALGENASVVDALTVAELDADGYEVRLNGSPVDLDDEVEDGDTILLVKKIKGNADGYITVRAGRLPGRIEEIALNGERTVVAALEAAELDAEGYEIRVNGQPATVDTGLDEGDTVLLVKKIKGN